RLHLPLLSAKYHAKATCKRVFMQVLPRGRRSYLVFRRPPSLSPARAATRCRGAIQSILAAVTLHAQHHLDKLREDLLGRLNAADLADDVLGAIFRHDPGQFLGLVVVLDVLET